MIKLKVVLDVTYYWNFNVLNFQKYLYFKYFYFFSIGHWMMEEFDDIYSDFMV